MRHNLVTWDRAFRRGLLVVAALLALADTWAGGHNPWVRAGFVIVIAGLVGYFTNFLAIKMLFQPKRGQVLGWRGLVPRNQAQIARSLGRNVQQQLLAPDIILAYLRERDLVDRATRNLADWVDASLQRPEIRRRLAAAVIDFANDRGPALLARGFDLSEQSLKRMARNPRLVDNYYQGVRAELLDYLRTESNRKIFAEQARMLLQHQLPQVAQWLNRALEDYLSSRRAVGSLGRRVKRLVAFDQDAIEDLLRRISDDPRFTEEFMELLDAIMEGIQRDLAAEGTRDRIYGQLESWIERMARVSRQSVLPAAINQLDAYLNDPANWSQIEDGLISSLQWLKNRFVHMLDSPTGQAYLRAGIERAVQRLNVTELVEQQVMRLDTDQLEDMVLDNTGGNLTVIQLLGGMLGLIAGTVQVHILFAIPIAGLLAVVWVAYGLNAHRHSDDT